MSKGYVFYMIVEDGAGGLNELTWTHLTKTEAMQMYKRTQDHMRDPVKEYGWKEMQ